MFEKAKTKLQMASSNLVGDAMPTNTSLANFSPTYITISPSLSNFIPFLDDLLALEFAFESKARANLNDFRSL